jgi:antitoxin (DNA-binding transcriptional repressor) of toxin-antitoxin stability system
MKRLQITKATAPLAEYARELKGTLVITEKGRPIAALVPIEGVDWESLAVGTNPKFVDLIERSRRRYEVEGGISSEEMRRHFGLPPFEETKPKARSRKSTGRNPKAKKNSQKEDGKKDGSQV